MEEFKRLAEKLLKVFELWKYDFNNAISYIQVRLDDEELKGIINRIDILLRTSDPYTKTVIKTFIEKIAKYDFTADELQDFIYQDFNIGEYPKNFRNWLPHGDRIKYIKRAYDEYNIENDGQMLRVAFDLEMIDICDEIANAIKKQVLVK